MGHGIERVVDKGPRKNPTTIVRVPAGDCKRILSGHPIAVGLDKLPVRAEILNLVKFVAQEEAALNRN